MEKQYTSVIRLKTISLFLLLSILLCSFSIRLKAQDISGTIITERGFPLDHVKVGLTGTKFTTSTNSDGSFKLTGIPPGTYIIIASLDNYDAVSKAITVSDQNISIDLKLIYATKQLEEVVVTSARQTNKNLASKMAAKIPISDIENPQVINVVPQQILLEQGANSYADVLRNVAGISTWSYVSSVFFSRGFSTQVNFRNGMTGYSIADFDISNLDQIEVIKGPSATLFGSELSSYGGLINRITKQPLDTTQVEISYQGGSYELSRLTADINTPIWKKKALFRLNVARQYNGSFQDAGFLRSTYFAPSLFYQANKKLSFKIDAEISSREATPQQIMIPSGSLPGQLTVDRPSKIPLDYRRSFINNQIINKNPTQAFYGQMNYKISEKWESQTNIVHIRSDNSGYFTSNILQGDSLLIRSVNTLNGGSIISQIQQNFNGDFKTGPFIHKVVLGLDYYNNKSGFIGNSLLGSLGMPGFDTLQIKTMTPGYSAITPYLIDKKFEPFAPSQNTSNQATYAAYVSDLIDFNSFLSAMISLRIDRFINSGIKDATTNTTYGKYSKTALSPKLGLVYQVIKKRLSLFGNYMNSFQNVAPIPQADGTIGIFKPQLANQFEFGAKADLIGGILNATVSYYDIRVDNMLRGDINRPNFQVQEGTQFSRGVEVDLLSKPISGLLINAGFAHNDSKYTSADADLEGLRPASSGPATTWNVYASYNFTRGLLNGFGIGFGGDYHSANLILNNRLFGKFELDAYTLFNAGLFYNSNHFRVSLNATNLSNSKYYSSGGSGMYTPGMLQSFIAGLTIKL